jgi:ABC-type oligopeptide transport system substrate-binding subunit
VAGKYGGRRTNQILPPGMAGFKRADNLYAYKGANVAKAKEVAGSLSGIPELRILHRTAASDVNRGQIMRYNLEQIGFKATTEAVPFAQLLARNGDKKNGKYDLIRLGWQADYPDPENFINVLLDGRQIPDEGSSNNSAYFNSAKFNKLMDDAAKLTGDARFNTYGGLDVQIMREAAPWAPIMNANNRLFFSSKVSNLIYNEANTNIAMHAIILK